MTGLTKAAWLFISTDPFLALILLGIAVLFGIAALGIGSY